MLGVNKKTAYAVIGLLPISGMAQGIGNEIGSLHGILEQLYDEMMPLCSNLIGVGQGIAGFATIWYIASRVWRIFTMRIFIPFLTIACS